MARGGARPGAGRPKGGISRMRLMLEEAALRGMAEHYYQQHPKDRKKVSQEEAATRAAADVVTQMMEDGKGFEVIKYSAYIATHSEDRKPEISLAEALAKLPKAPEQAPPPPPPPVLISSSGRQRKK